jgi:hypothetical protein
MTGRNRSGNRPASMKARLGIAAAVLLGGGAIGVTAVAASSHGTAAGTTTKAESAGFILNFHQSIPQGEALADALSYWGQSQQRSLTTLAEIAPVSSFSDPWHHKTQFAIQRGVVVLATHKFLLVKSKNHVLRLWWLTGGTAFKDVSNTTSSGTAWTALTGNDAASFQAVANDNTAPAATAVAGSTTVVTELTEPVTKTTTVDVNTGTETIAVTITTTTATVVPVTTTTTTVTTPVTTTTTTPTWLQTKGVARGDLVLVAGVKEHGNLIAKLVLFAAPNPGTPTPTPSATVTIPATPTATPTSAVTDAATPLPSETVSGLSS